MLLCDIALHATPEIFVGSCAIGCGRSLAVNLFIDKEDLDTDSHQQNFRLPGDRWSQTQTYATMHIFIRQSSKVTADARCIIGN